MTDLPLSPRQRDVLSATADGMNATRTAAMLGISVNTVKIHLGAARRRMGAANTIQAVARAIRSGVI